MSTNSETVDLETVAEGCVCGRCTPVCRHRPFLPCCGACHVGGPYPPPASGPDSPAEFWAGHLLRHPEDAAENALITDERTEK